MRDGTSEEKLVKELLLRKCTAARPMVAGDANESVIVAHGPELH